MLLRCRLLRSRPAARVDRSVLLLATAAAFTSYHTLPITSCASRRARWVVVAVVKGVGAAQLRPRRRLRLSVWHRAMRLWMPQGGRRRRESQIGVDPSHPPLTPTACNHCLLATLSCTLSCTLILSQTCPTDFSELQGLTGCSGMSESGLCEGDTFCGDGVFECCAQQTSEDFGSVRRAPRVEALTLATT